MGIGKRSLLGAVPSPPLLHAVRAQHDVLQILVMSPFFTRVFSFVSKSVVEGLVWGLMSPLHAVHGTKRRKKG